MASLPMLIASEYLIAGIAENGDLLLEWAPSVPEDWIAQVEAFPEITSICIGGTASGFIVAGIRVDKTVVTAYTPGLLTVAQEFDALTGVESVYIDNYNGVAVGIHTSGSISVLSLSGADVSTIVAALAQLPPDFAQISGGVDGWTVRYPDGSCAYVGDAAIGFDTDVSSWVDVVDIVASTYGVLSFGLRSDGTVAVGEASALGGFPFTGEIESWTDIKQISFDDSYGLLCGVTHAGGVVYAGYMVGTELALLAANESDVAGIAFVIGEPYPVCIRSNGWVVVYGEVTEPSNPAAIDAPIFNLFYPQYRLASAFESVYGLGAAEFVTLAGRAACYPVRHIFGDPLHYYTLPTFGGHRQTLGKQTVSIWRNAVAVSSEDFTLTDNSGNTIPMLSADIQLIGTIGISATIVVPFETGGQWAEAATFPCVISAGAVDLYLLDSLEWKSYTGSKNRAVVLTSAAQNGQRQAQEITLPSPVGASNVGATRVLEFAGFVDAVPADTADIAGITSAVVESVHIHLKRGESRSWIYG